MNVYFANLINQLLVLSQRVVNTSLSNVSWAELQSIGLLLEEVLAEQVFTSDGTREQKHKEELTKSKTEKVT